MEPARDLYWASAQASIADYNLLHLCAAQLRKLICDPTKLTEGPVSPHLPHEHSGGRGGADILFGRVSFIGGFGKGSQKILRKRDA